MKSQIVLIRHGETIGSEMNLTCGNADVPITKAGKEKLIADRDAGLYPSGENAWFFVSGMLRTIQTLKLIYGDVPYVVIEDICEIDYGNYELLCEDELKDRPEFYKWMEALDFDSALEKGESFNTFMDRVKKGFQTLLTVHHCRRINQGNGSEITDICVCHGGVFMVIMESLWPGEKSNFLNWEPKPGHGYILHLEDDKIMGKTEF